MKRPLFLLEVVIAIALVGLFSVYFLRSSLQHLYKERKALVDLELEWQRDLHRMKILSEGWKTAKENGDVIEKTCKVTLGERTYSKTYAYHLTAIESPTARRLALKEGRKNGDGIIKERTYYFLANK